MSAVVLVNDIVLNDVKEFVVVVSSYVGFQTVTFAYEFRQILWVTGLLVFPLKCAFSLLLTMDGFIIPTIVGPIAQFARFGWCMLVKYV